MICLAAGEKPISRVYTPPWNKKNPGNTKSRIEDDIEGVRLKFDVISPKKTKTDTTVKENRSPHRPKDGEVAKVLNGEFVFMLALDAKNKILCDQDQKDTSYPRR